MASDREIKIALDRAAKALQLRPGLALSTMKTSARVGEGLSCVAKEGDWSLEMDLPKGYGGENTAPSPGVFGRACLTGCLAMGLKQKAAQMGVPIEAIEVSLEAECDDRGDFGLDGVAPGFLEFRLAIRVESPAEREEVERAIAQNLELSPWLDVFARAQKIETQIEIESRAAAAE